MAHRTHHPMDASKSDVKRIYASGVGAGAADLTSLDDDLVTATWTGAGTYSLVFRHAYPKKCHYSVKVLGTTAGLEGKFSAWDPAAKTATLVLAVGGVATDAAAADTVLIAMDVRNTRAND